MDTLLIVLLVAALVLFGLGFFLKLLWWLAVICIIVFVVRLIFGPRRVP